MNGEKTYLAYTQGHTDKKQETIDNFLILFSYNREKEYFCYHKISIIYESIFQ